MHILFSKLKKLKICLKAWNRYVFGNLKRNILFAEHNLTDVEKCFDVELTPANRQNLNKHKAIYFAQLKNEELFCKQKSRINWFAEGDANTFYFHAFCKNRHNYLYILKSKPFLVFFWIVLMIFKLRQLISSLLFSLILDLLPSIHLIIFSLTSILLSRIKIITCLICFFL